MLALVSTPRFLLLVDIGRRSVVPLECDRPEYYGISWLPAGGDLMLSHSGLDSDSLVDLASYARSEVGWISVGAARSPRCLSAPHQILCASDGRVVCANTGRNCVTILDPSRPGHFQEATLGDARWDRLAPGERAGLHVNSVFESGGLLHVLAHGFEHGSRLATFRYPSMEPVSFEPLPGLTGLHNYCVTSRGERIACHSAAGSLVDPHDGRVHWRSGVSSYLRGLAVGPREILVGDSPKLGRNLRASAVSGLWVIDRGDSAVRDHIVLGPFGTVNEVRLLDVPDEAHHGRPFTGIAALVDKDAHRDLSKRRIAAAGRAREADATLPFRRIVGSPEIDAAGHWIASGELCLLLARHPSPSRIAMGYDLANASPTDHAALVLGHEGQSGAVSESQWDTNMDVLLVSRGRPESPPALVHWTHDGLEWKAVGTLLEALPAAGTLSAERAEDAIVLAIDGREAIRLPAARFGRVQHPWGFRWQGTAILPEVTRP